MKLSRSIFLSLTILLMFLLIGCQDNSTEKISNTINNLDMNYINKKINNETTDNLIYEVKQSKWFLEGTRRIDTYAEYLEFFTDSTIEYNEEYFESSGLILYGIIESSGSIQVNITSLELNADNHLTIHVGKMIPTLLTMDIKNHGFIIEYQKLNEPIADISVTQTIKCHAQKEFILKDEESKNAIDHFMNEVQDNLINISTTIWFIDNTDLSGLTRNERKAHFEKVNNEKVAEYGIDQLSNSMYVSMYSPIVSINFTSFNVSKFDKLYDISLIDNIGTVYLTITYEKTSIINDSQNNNQEIYETTRQELVN